jgi:hypothetical protein
MAPQDSRFGGADYRSTSSTLVHFSNDLRRTVTRYPQHSGDAACNSATIGVWRSLDPSLHEEAVKPWELLTDLPAGEPFLHEMRYLSAPSFTVYEEHFSCAVRLRGQSPPGFIVLAVPIRLPPKSTCWKDP